VLAFNGSVLMFLCLYAFINAIGGFLAGGHEPELDWALGYATAAHKWMRACGKPLG